MDRRDEWEAVAIRLVLALTTFAVIGGIALGVYLVPHSWLADVIFNPPEGAYRQDIGEQIEQWFSTAEEGDRLVLAELAGFEWDRVVVFDPYMSDDDTELALGFRWHIESQNVAMLDGVNVVGFALGDHMVAWTDVRIGGPLFTFEGQGKVTSRDGAVFIWSTDCAFGEGACVRLGP